MGIIRTRKRDNIAFFDRSVLDDETLSWRAKGIAAYILSHPNEWHINTNDLWQRSKDGRDAVLSGLRELEAAGYLQRTKARDNNGKFTWEHVLHEAINGKPGPGNPTTENQGIYKGTSYLMSSSPGNDDDYARYAKELQRVWGRFISSEYEKQCVEEWVDRVPFESWSYALEESVKAGHTARNWRYLTPILERVEAEGARHRDKPTEPVEVDAAWIP